MLRNFQVFSNQNHIGVQLVRAKHCVDLAHQIAKAMKLSTHARWTDLHRSEQETCTNLAEHVMQLLDGLKGKK